MPGAATGSLSVPPAQQVFSAEFDDCFSRVPASVQRQIERRVDLLGASLNAFAHQRLQGVVAFKLRVGDYRVIYTFDASANTLNLITLGHRREIYRSI